MASRSNGQHTVPITGLVFAMLIWGSSFSVMKIAVTVMDPLLVIFFRMLVAATLALFFVRRFCKFQYRKGDWKPLLFMALCEPCFYFSLEGYALRFTSASEAGMITALLPVISAITVRFVLKEFVSRRTAFGLVLALMGALGLTLAGKPTVHAPDPALGDVLEFMAMGCAAAYATTSRALSERYSAFFLTGFQSLVGTVFFMPALFFSSVPIPERIDWLTLSAIVYLGAVVNVGAYFLYNYGLSLMPVNRVSAYLNLIPVFSVLLGWLILNERLTPPQYVFAGLVLGGTLLSQMVPRMSDETVDDESYIRAGKHILASGERVRNGLA